MNNEEDPLALSEEEIIKMVKSKFIKKIGATKELPEIVEENLKKNILFTQEKKRKSFIENRIVMTKFKTSNLEFACKKYPGLQSLFLNMRLHVRLQRDSMVKTINDIIANEEPDYVKSDSEYINKINVVANELFDMKINTLKDEFDQAARKTVKELTGGLHPIKWKRKKDNDISNDIYYEVINKLLNK